LSFVKKLLVPKEMYSQGGTNSNSFDCLTDILAYSYSLISINGPFFSVFSKEDSPAVSLSTPSSPATKYRTRVAVHGLA